MTLVNLRSVVRLAGIAIGCAASAAFLERSATADPATPADLRYCDAVADYLAAKSGTTTTPCDTMVSLAKIGCNAGRAEKAKGRDEEHVVEEVAESVRPFSESKALAIAIVAYGSHTYCPEILRNSP